MKRNEEQIEFRVKSTENINTLLEYMTEHFSKNNDRRRSTVSENDSKNSVKLPQMKIVTFIGWLAFKDSFETMINNYLTFTKIEKFNYPQCYLDEEPLKAISEIVLINNNYMEAKAALI